MVTCHKGFENRFINLVFETDSTKLKVFLGQLKFNINQNELVAGFSFHLI